MFIVFYSLYSFTTSRSIQYLSTPQSSLFSFWVQQYVSDLSLVAETGQQHSSSIFWDKHPPAYPAYSAFIRHGPFHFNILNDIKHYSTSSRNRNRGNRGNIKSRQRDPSRLRLCFLQPGLSLPEWVNLPARVSAHAPQLSLSPSQISWRILPQSPSEGISRVHFQGQNSTRILPPPLLQPPRLGRPQQAAASEFLPPP